MHHHKAAIVLLHLMLTLPYLTDAQTNPKLITANLQKFTSMYPQEKIHVHLDKPFYSAGDTVYMKAYLVNAEKNLPSGISNLVYVDLIGMENNLVNSIMLPAWDGIAWGSISLPDTLAEGMYRIRAYTKWMRNFDNHYFFDKTLPLVNAVHSQVSATVQVLADSTGGLASSRLIVHYQDNKGGVVKATGINYEVLINGKILTKGNTVTDSSGSIRIKIGNPTLASTDKLELVTHVVNGNKRTVSTNNTIDATPRKPVTTFFPEGGQLIFGLHTKVGFKAVAPNGLGMAVEGTVFNTAGNQVTRFASGFAGIGSFEITPFAGNEYYAVLQYADGRKDTVQLPKPQQQGYALVMENNDAEKITVHISSANMPGNSQLLLVGQSNGTVQYIASTSLPVTGFSGTIPSRKFGTGIVQFTLFDSLLRPLAERLMFINHQDQLRTAVTTDKQQYSGREAVQLSLEAKDETGNPVTGSFSVAVTSRSNAPDDDDKERTILSDLLLTSDLRGYVEQPNYYFSHTDSLKAKELDNLLLTQGWRRFTWPDIIAGHFPEVKFTAEKSLSVSGKVSFRSGQPVPGGKVTFLSKTGDGFILDTVTNMNGRFAFTDLDIGGDSIPFSIQAQDMNGNDDVVVDIDPTPPEPVTAFVHAPDTALFTGTALQNYVQTESLRLAEVRRNQSLENKPGTLREVVVKSKTASKIEEAVAPSANLNGPGKADQILTYMDLRTCNDLAACLQGKLRGVIFKMLLDTQSNTVNVVPFSTMGMGSPMMVMLDGMEMNIRQGGASLDNIPPSNVQSIEVLRSGAYLSTYGLRGRGGIIIITTKKGGINYEPDLPDKEANQRKGMLFGTARAYHTSREFYSPAYDAPAALNSKDWRSTIYWKPDIVTDEFGKATVRFYNADITGTYKVVLEGISENGQLGRSVYLYEVK